MKYYLIDENKVREYFENVLVYRNIHKTTAGNFIITINDVNYEIDNDSLILSKAYPLSENARALTTEGLIEWKKSTIKIYKYANGTSTYSSKIYNFSAMSIIDNNFCSSFICIGKIPPENRLKFTAKDIKVYNFQSLLGCISTYI